MTTTITKTVGPGGAPTYDYSSLSNWETGQQADITLATGNDTIQEAVCYSMQDTTALSVYGWTTAAANYIRIYTPSSERHSGTWNVSKYYLDPSNVVSVTIREDFVRIEGLQVTNNSPSANGRHVFYVYGQSVGGSDIRISYCIGKGHADATYNQEGVYLNQSTITCNIWNCIFFNFTPGITGNNIIVNHVSGILANVYSCTIISGYTGVYRGAGTIVCKNCYVGGTGLQTYYGNPTLTTCASSDDKGTAGLQNIAVNTTQFVNVSAGTEDFHLAGAGSALYAVGTDTSGDSAPLNFTDDIDGDTRTGTWDIGADAITAPALSDSLGDTLPLISDSIAAILGSHRTVTISDTMHLASDAVYPPPVSAHHLDGNVADVLEIIQDAIRATLARHREVTISDTMQVVEDLITSGMIDLKAMIHWVAPLKIIPRTDTVDPLYLAAHAVRHPSLYFTPRIQSYGTFTRAISAPVGFVKTGDVTVDVLDPDNVIRQGIAEKTIRKARAELRLGPERGSYSAFLRPLIREVGTISQPQDGLLQIPLRDFTYDWLEWQIPGLINIANFPNLPENSPSNFANLVIGSVSAATGAIPCPLVDTVSHAYLVNRHPSKSVDEVYRKRGDESEFSLVDPAEYTVTMDTFLQHSLGWGDNCTLIEFAVDQAGAEIRANVQGIVDENGDLRCTNFTDAILEIFQFLVGVTNSLDRINFASFDEVRVKTADLDCAGAWTQAITFGEALTQLQRSSNIDIFNDKNDRISVAYTSDDDDPVVHLDDLLRLYKGTVSQQLAEPVFTRFPYRYAPNFADGSWTNDEYSNEADEDALGEAVEDEPLQMYFVRDAETALTVISHRASWMDLNAFRFEGTIPLVPTVETLELAQIVSIEHFGGIAPGGYAAEQFKILELSMDVDHLAYHFKGIRRTIPAPVFVESTPSLGGPAVNSRFGPYYDQSTGHLFAVFRYPANTGKTLVMWRSSDYGATWERMDDAHTPSLTNVIGSWDRYVQSGIYHIATQETSSGRVAYHSFSTITGLWVTVNEEVVASCAGGGKPCVSIEPQGEGGDPLIFFQGDKELINGQYFHRGWYTALDGAWSAPAMVTPDPGQYPENLEGLGHADFDSSHCYVQRVIRGLEGRMHFFYSVDPSVISVVWSPDNYSVTMNSGVLSGQTWLTHTNTSYEAPENVSDFTLWDDNIGFIRRVGFGYPAIEIFQDGPTVQKRVGKLNSSSHMLYDVSFTGNPTAFTRYINGRLYSIQQQLEQGCIRVLWSDDEGGSWTDGGQASPVVSWLYTMDGDIVTINGTKYLTYFSSPWQTFRWMKLSQLPY